MSSKSFFGFKYGGSKKASIPKTVPPVQSSPVVFQPNADEMRRVFDKFDKNKDGKISKEEYVSAVDILGSKTAKTEVSKAFEAIDTDGDGFVDFNEFMAAQGGVKAGDIKSAFKVFDLDGNGKITAEELVQVLRQLGERCSLEACRKMVRGADADGDGMIDVDEFVGLMTRTMKSA
ncbi:putative EF-hand domain-containing protein [Helianthus annuus]|nr:putative EF-hand domain-containing protein [Helianthus annuus]